MTMYAGDNDDYLLPAKLNSPLPNPVFVQLGLEPTQAEAARQLGLDATQTNGTSIWACP